MAEVLVAKGGVWDVGELADYEGHFAEGEEGIVDFELSVTPSSDMVDALESGIRSAGVTLTRSIEVVGGSSHVRIYFKKGVWPLAIIIAVAVAIGIITLMIAWSIYKVVSEVPPTMLTWQVVLLIALAIVAVTVIVILVARRGRIKAAGVVVGK